MKLSRLCVIGRNEGILPEDVFVDRLRQLDKPSLWTEKDALREVLARITYAYRVGLIYYAGDFDPSGISIYNSLKERLTNFGEYGQYINFKRVALTPEQIAEYNLPSDPAKRKDPNYKRFVAKYGDQVVELDALPPDVLRNIIKDCIIQHIDPILSGVYP